MACIFTHVATLSGVLYFFDMFSLWYHFLSCPKDFNFFCSLGLLMRESSIFCMLKGSFFALHFEREVPVVQSSRLAGLSFSAIEDFSGPLTCIASSSPFLCAQRVSFLLVASTIVSLSVASSKRIVVCLAVIFFVFLVLSTQRASRICEFRVFKFEQFVPFLRVFFSVPPSFLELTPHTADGLSVITSPRLSHHHLFLFTLDNSIATATSPIFPLLVSV